MAAPADVPTMQEAGLKGYVHTTWYGLWAPARTPDTIVSRLNAATAKVLAAAGTTAVFEKAGIEAESASAERFGVMCAQSSHDGPRSSVARTSRRSSGAFPTVRSPLRAQASARTCCVNCGLTTVRQ
jgi:hypothetical protein